MIRLVGLVQSQPFLIALKQVGFPPGRGVGASLLGGGNGLVKPTRFRISRPQGAEKFRLFILGEDTSAFSVSDGFWSIAESGIGAGGQEPGQLVQASRLKSNSMAPT